MRNFFVLALACLVQASSVQRKHEEIRREVSPQTYINHVVDDESLSFLITGDNGGLPEPMYSTEAQRNVAAFMAAQAKEHDCKFVLELGDNFYFLGVKDIYDKRWKGTFEDVYSDPSLYIPWYITTGNHDWHGSVQAQIDYSKISDRWTFPWYWYTLDHTLSQSSLKIRIVMFETTIPCGIGLIPDGVPLDDDMADEQWKWLEQQLIEGQDADYLIVTGHYPVFSAGKSGPMNECLREKMMPMLELYRVSAFIAGHDHNVQIMNAADGSETKHVIVGCSSDMTADFPNVDDGRFNVDYMWPKNFVEATDQLRFYRGCFARADVTPTEFKLTFFEGAQGSTLTDLSIPRRDLTVL